MTSMIHTGYIPYDKQKARKNNGAGRAQELEQERYMHSVQRVTIRSVLLGHCARDR